MQRSVIDASFVPSEELGAGVLALYTSPTLSDKTDLSKQCYAFAGDVLRLVRLEDAQGRIRNNTYAVPHWRVGMSVAGVMDPEWIRLLKSQNPVEVLSALVFLGGSRSDFREVEQILSQEETTWGEAIDPLHDSETVQCLIEQHRHSPVKWIQEAAELALKPEQR